MTATTSVLAPNLPSVEDRDGFRNLNPQPGPICHPVATAPFQSPLRYPGAKSKLAPTIDTIIRTAGEHPKLGRIDLLVEPFAGGGSVSLRLLGNGTVERALLADRDPMVAAFWQQAAGHPEELIDRMYDEHTRFVAAGGARAVERWDYWRSWTPDGRNSERTRIAHLAMKCLFLNRTTFSGILHGAAGPLGGRAQISAYGIGCRFNPDGLAERIRYIGHLYSIGRIVDVWNYDWERTLLEVSERYPMLLPSKVVAYLDPPYIDKADKLYREWLQPGTDPGGRDRFPHYVLAEHLVRKAQFRWILSYDHHPDILESPWMYKADRMTPSVEDREFLGVRSWPITKRLVSMRYTASTKQSHKTELLLSTLPPSTIPVAHPLYPPADV